VHLSKLAAVEEAGEGKAFAVWNLLGFRRDDVVELDLPEGWQGCRVYNDDGLEVPSQVFEGKVLFIAESVPAFGYLVFRLKQAEPAEPTGAQTEESGPLLELNRGRYEVRMERHSGCIIYLKDQKTGRIYLKPLNWFYQKTKENNVFSIAHETPHYMSAWNIGSIARIDRLVRDAKVTLKAEGPVAEIVEIEHRFRESAIRQYVRFYRDLPRMDFFTRVQWNETSGSETDAPMLQVSFCPDLEETGRFTCEIPFGAIERPADGTEYPAQRWVDISGSGSGFTLVNDCKYGFHADGNRLTMTCIRTSYAPDPEPDKGEHRFNYALIPHEQSWQEAGSAEHGAAFNSPLHALEIENFGSPARMEPGADLLTLEGTGVKITSLKPSHDGRGYVLRLCEYFGRESLFKLAFCRKPAKVIEESVTEDKAGRQLPMSDNPIEDTLPPHGILTLKIIPETPGAK
jgi:alpha-mannosidase